MPSDFYITLQSTIEYTQRILAKYLASANYTHPYTDQEIKLYLERNNIKRYAKIQHPLNPVRFIFVTSDYRNPYLTAERIKNILEVMSQMKNVLQGASYTMEGPDLEAKLNDVKTKLEKALTENNQISILHSKSHCSYRQNYLLRLGFFARLWNTTLFQSRATIALEKCINYFDKMIIQIAPPVPSSVPLLSY